MQQKLLFLHNGQVQLEESGKTVWASDSDPEFTEEFEGDFFNYDDAQEILEYLEEQEIVAHPEEVIIEEDSLVNGNGPGDDDDDEDDDDDWDDDDES